MTNELTLQWRGLRDKLMRGDEEEETVPVMIETGDMLVREIERLTRERDVSRAAIDQLHAAVKTAQELAATRLMDVGRLTRERHEYKIWWERDSKSLGTALNDLSLERACKQDLQAQLRQVVAIGFEAGVEAQRRSHEPCERHRWKPGMWNVYYVRSDGQERPALSAETAKGAANALRQDAADLVRVIESEGASRDASSTGSSLPPTQHVAGGWGYSCTEAVRCSHGKVDGECLVIPCAHYGQKT